MSHNFLIVGYREASYAINAESVQEIVWLPELSAIEEQPDFIRGIFNLRGQVIPVLDLGLRFGYGRQPAMLEHRLVVIEHDSRRLGILVHELYDLISAEQEAIEEVGRYQLPGNEANYIRGVLKHEDGLHLLLDLNALRNEASTAALGQFELSSAPTMGEDGLIFHNRALELALVPSIDNASERASYVLIKLGGETIGLEVGSVRELSHLRDLTPIPCSPAHIAGNMNLRGDILTLMDIRGLLGLQAHDVLADVVTVQVEDSVFGIAVEGIEDVITLDIGAVYAASQTTNDMSAEWCSGTANLDDRVISLIDITRLFTALQIRTTAGSTPFTP